MRSREDESDERQGDRGARLGKYVAPLFIVGTLAGAAYGTVQVLQASAEIRDLQAEGAPDTEMQDAKEDLNRGSIILWGSFALGAAGAVTTVIYGATTGFEERRRLTDGTAEDIQA